MTGLIAVAVQPDQRTRLIVNVDGAVVAIDMTSALCSVLAEALKTSDRVINGLFPCDWAGEIFRSSEGAVQVFGDLLEFSSGGSDQGGADLGLLILVGGEKFEAHMNAPTKNPNFLCPREYDGPLGVPGAGYPDVVFRRDTEAC